MSGLRAGERSRVASACQAMHVFGSAWVSHIDDDTEVVLLPVLDDIIAAREAAVRADVLAKVEALHAPYRIYDECGHEHTDEDYEAGRCVEAAEIGYVCDEGLLYVICRECCCDYDGFNYWQTESCVNGHVVDHTTVVGPSLCPTRALIADLGSTDD